MCADCLHRAQRLLTEDHRTLIKILAGRAVEDYLREVEAEQHTDDKAGAVQCQQ